MDTNFLRPTTKLHWKSDKTQKERNKCNGAEHGVGYGRHQTRKSSERGNFKLTEREEIVLRPLIQLVRLGS
jgi:hypothetical protein